MKEIINKISSYNLFNYLFPGVLFVVLLKETTNYNLVQENIVEGAFVYYFFGLMISRIGTLAIEPILKKFKFLRYKPYPSFVKASKEDEKLNVLSESNNMLRTLCTLFLILIMAISLSWMGLNIDFSNGIVKLFFVLALFGILLFSYRKQTNYIFRRIDSFENNTK